MPDNDPALDDAIREIANLLATAYLRNWPTFRAFAVSPFRPRPA